MHTISYVQCATTGRPQMHTLLLLQCLKTMLGFSPSSTAAPRMGKHLRAAQGSSLHAICLSCPYYPTSLFCTDEYKVGEFKCYSQALVRYGKKHVSLL